MLDSNDRRLLRRWWLEHPQPPTEGFVTMSAEEYEAHQALWELYQRVEQRRRERMKRLLGP